MTQLPLLTRVAGAAHARASPLLLRELPEARVEIDPESCNSLELLAALIHGPRAGATAQALLQRYGTLAGLAAAPASELVSTPGVGPMTAIRIRAAVELFGRRLRLEQCEPRVIRSPAEAAALIAPRLEHREQEYLYVLLLNTRNGVIGGPIEVYRGSLNAALIRGAEVFREAVRLNAAGIILVHNHPTGDPSPSPEDVAVTKVLGEAGRLLDIELLDHLVIGQNRFVSLKERGLGF